MEWISNVKTNENYIYGYKTTIDNILKRVFKEMGIDYQGFRKNVLEIYISKGDTIYRIRREKEPTGLYKYIISVDNPRDLINFRYNLSKIINEYNKDVEKLKKSIEEFYKKYPSNPLDVLNNLIEFYSNIRNE